MNPRHKMIYTNAMSKMGRPKLPSDEVRDEIVMLRLTKSEKKVLRRGNTPKTPLTKIIRTRLFPTNAGQ